MARVMEGGPSNLYGCFPIKLWRIQRQVLATLENRKAFLQIAQYVRVDRGSTARRPRAWRKYFCWRTPPGLTPRSPRLREALAPA